MFQSSCCRDFGTELLGEFCLQICWVNGEVSGRVVYDRSVYCPEPLLHLMDQPVFKVMNVSSRRLTWPGYLCVRPWMCTRTAILFRVMGTSWGWRRDNRGKGPFHCLRAGIKVWAVLYGGLWIGVQEAECRFSFPLSSG